MRRVAHLGWLAPVASACLVAGCGVLPSAKPTPAPKTLSHGRFVYLADGACRRFLRRVIRRGRATTFAKARANLKKALFADERMLFVLNRLAPPASDAVAYRRLLATANDQDIVLHQLLESGDAAAPQRVKTIGRRLERLDGQFDTRASRLGLRVCARA